MQIYRVCMTRTHMKGNMDNKGEIVIYQTQDGTTQLDVRMRTNHSRG